MYMKWIIMLILLASCVEAKLITEINYNPEGEDNNFEYIEVDFNYSGINASIYSAGKTIGNNLNNDFDVVFLKKNGSVEDVAYYSSEFGGSGNDKSICKKDFVFVECK